jgi:DNA-binding NarL/FixJ family response regulator
MDIISIVIADDHVIFRKGLRTILNEIPFVKVIAEASDGNELLRLLKKEAPDIILMRGSHQKNYRKLPGYICDLFNHA